MKLFLSVEEGPAKGKTFSIPEGETLKIGRSAQTHTKINDPRMSREHCALSRNADGSLQLSDLGSSSGTQFEGENINEATIWAGAEFEAGDSLFVIMTEEELESRKAGTKIRGENDLSQLVGREIAGYRLDSVIGTGSTGMVFKATAIQSQKTVAVKILFPRFTTSEQSQDRFVRAMKTMLPIKSPNIIEIYGAGKRGPFCWYAMKYIDGQCLSDVIERIGITGMLNWQVVWKVAVDIAKALKAGFKHRIIHRNLTPNNIIWRTDDKVCFLGDFIFAKALDDTVCKQITQPGQLIGDLAYMSPERTLENGIVDTRSDLYGLGATCYALLTGQPPAEGDTLPEMINHIRKSPPRAPKEFQLAVDDSFQRIVLKLLDKDPENRFPNPEILLNELEKVGKFNNLKIETS